MEKQNTIKETQQELIKEQVRKVIISLHQYFEDWLGGKLINTLANTAYLENAFDKEFIMVLPTGVVQMRSEAVEGLKKAWGVLPGLKITISDVQVLHDDASSILAVYKETQTIGNTKNVRTSSVVFNKVGDELKWLFVQETMVIA